MDRPPAIEDAMQHNVAEQANALTELLRSLGKVAVAFSGGVDSAVVAQAARLALGDGAVAVTAVSPSLAQGELEIARRVAGAIGIRHEVIETGEFGVPGYQANAGDRCYFCKSELYTELGAILDRLQVSIICNGANLDDLGDHRPGMRAANEHQVRSPLIEAGLNKQDVRKLAKYWNIEVWDKPAAPCLSSRIAYGVEVTPERVKMIDQAEQFLRNEIGIRELRVRLERNGLARIEVPINELERLIASPTRELLLEELTRIGFRYVTVDLAGFRSGSLNAALPMVSLEVAEPASRGRI